MFCRLIGGRVTEYAVWGDVTFRTLAPTTDDCRLDVQLNNISLVNGLVPNTQCFQPSSTPGTYTLSIPKGGSNAIALRYKVTVTLDDAKNQVPLAVAVSWSCEPDTAAVDVSYAVSQTLPVPLTGVSFVAAVGPEGSVASLVRSTPTCMYMSIIAFLQLVNVTHPL
jgi:hypothetical protein